MSHGVREMMFDAGTFERIARIARIDPERLVADFGDPDHADALAEADGLLTGWQCPKISAEALERMPRLRAIIHTAGSVKWHVTAACWERGVAVSSQADANALPVAEYTLAAILFAGKRVLPSAHEFRRIRRSFSATRRLGPLGNFRSVVGIVGASRIGRRVIELLAPFDLEIVVYDPYLPTGEAAALGARKVDLDDLMRISDVVTVHAPGGLPETSQLIDRHRLALLRDGATLINTAHGSVVETDALTAELVSGRIDAILDLTEPEPLPAGSPLWELPNVLLTPHIAGSHGNELSRMVGSAIDELARFARGLPFEHPVDAEALAISA